MIAKSELFFSVLFLVAVGQQFSPSCSAQGEPLGSTCALIVLKSCSEIWGDFPDPNGYCEDQPCASEDYCTDGEAMVVYYARGLTEAEWTSLKYKKTVIAPEPGGAGRDYSIYPDSDPCLYRSVCEYECEFLPGEGNRCSQRFLTRLGLEYHDDGPCVIPTN